MKFFIRLCERPCADPQELAAMLGIRIRALDYRADLLDTRRLEYSFYLEGGSEGIQLAEVDTLKELDVLLKRDPLFPYCKITSTPVEDTAWLIEEAQDFLQEQIISPSRAKELVHPLTRPLDDETYYLVTKEVMPYSPLLPEDEQEEIFRRTVRSQDAHENRRLEFADHNPVGQQVGLLVGCGSEEEILAHVQNCEVYPDTVVTSHRLLTLRGAYLEAVAALGRLRRHIPSSRHFANRERPSQQVKTLDMVALAEETT